MLLTKLANQEIVNFLRTVTIKNGYFADQLKKALVNEQYWGSLPEERNPYYMHLLGRYILAEDMPVVEITDPTTGIKYQQTYSSEFNMPNADGLTTTRVRNARIYTEDAFDEMMYVTSLDTQETIPFTRENLHGDPANPAATVHKKTREAYRIPSSYFNVLCEKYPKQVDLIKSIVYLIPPKELTVVEKSLYGENVPSDDELRLQAVREAEHLDLLNYDSSILEDREELNLIWTIRSFLELMRKRWDVKEYTFEENFAAVQWSTIWSLLPLILVSQRYANIRSPYVHSSHVWDFLTSNGLDSYRGYLSSSQEWFLYKNIKFLRENSGQHRILNILIDNLLTEYNLHIESKTIVMDKTNITEPTEIGTNYAEQCENCCRKNSCYKKITNYKCLDFVGKLDQYKPEPVILTENLPGARKDKIITLLKERYDCTDEEAETRYDRSFVWRDEAIELIKSELDRDQTVDMGGITEDLPDVISREYDSKLEPEYNTDIVEDQRNDLRHVNSTYLPTKLLEITEDPVEPKYDEMFTKFVTDTILHLAPKLVNGDQIGRITESYSITVGQEALDFIFNFGELIAALYLGFIKENAIELRTDVNTGTVSNPKFANKFLSNFRDFKTFEFKIPTKASIGFTFKLGKPVKQQDLVDAWADGKTEDDLFELITNKDANTRIVTVNGTMYAVTSREKTSTDLDWEDYNEVLTVIGRFKSTFNKYIYTESNGEIGIIPTFFRWHYDHLHISAYKDWDDLTSNVKNPKTGDVAAVWTTRKVYLYTATSTWREIKATDGLDISQIVFVVNPPLTGTTTSPSEVSSITIYDQNRIRTTTTVEGEVVDNFINDAGESVDADGNPFGEFKSFEDFAAFVDNATAFVVEKCKIENFVNVDWILDNLWVDFLKTVTSQEEIGEYFEKMFTIYERLDIIRSSCGDIKTKLAIKKFIESILIDQSTVTGTSSSEETWIDQKRKSTTFNLVMVGDNLAPTYEDWFNYNSEVGDNIKKLEESAESENLWSEFTSKLYQKLLEGCGIVYADSGTDKARYHKLKALVRSLSSYLINFIDTNTNERVSTELSHLAENSPSHVIEFTSYVNFDAVGQTDLLPRIGNVDDDIYVVTTDLTAQEGVQYYMHDITPTESDAFEFVEAYKLDKYDAYSKVCTYKPIETGDNLMIDDQNAVQPVYIKTNLRELLELKTTDHLKVWSEVEADTDTDVDGDNVICKNSQWFYAIGREALVDGEKITKMGTLSRVADLPSKKQVGDFYYIVDLDTNYLWWEVDNKTEWIDIGKWDGYVQTFPADSRATKITDAAMTEATIKMIGETEHLGTKTYKRPVSKSVIIWSGARRNETLTKFMNSMITSTHVDTQSTVETATMEFINTDTLS